MAQNDLAKTHLRHARKGITRLRISPQLALPAKNVIEDAPPATQRPLPGIGNISGNKIGKNGNAVRLLAISRAAPMTTYSSEKISARANHFATATARQDLRQD